MRRQSAPEPENIYAKDLYPKNGLVVLLVNRCGENVFKTMGPSAQSPGCGSRMPCQLSSYRFYAYVLCDVGVLCLNPSAVCISDDLLFYEPRINYALFEFAQFRSKMNMKIARA